MEIDRDSHAQELIDKGACPACLTYPARRDNHAFDSGIRGFCSGACHDYYVRCHAYFYDVRWRRAKELAEVELLRHLELYGSQIPEEITL